IELLQLIYQVFDFHGLARCMRRGAGAFENLGHYSLAVLRCQDSPPVAQLLLDGSGHQPHGARCGFLPRETAQRERTIGTLEATPGYRRTAGHYPMSRQRGSLPNHCGTRLTAPDKARRGQPVAAPILITRSEISGPLS